MNAAVMLAAALGSAALLGSLFWLAAVNRRRRALRRRLWHFEESGKGEAR